MLLMCMPQSKVKTLRFDSHSLMTCCKQSVDEKVRLRQLIAKLERRKQNPRYESGDCIIEFRCQILSDELLDGIDHLTTFGIVQCVWMRTSKCANIIIKVSAMTAVKLI